MAEIQRNEITDSQRTIDLVVNANGYTPAPRQTNFMALGIVFVSDAANMPNYKVATGTMVNKRRPLVVADDVVESTDTGADNITLTGHAYEIGDGPFTSDKVMGTVAIGAPFWLIFDDANKVGIAATLEDAYAGVRVALLGTETGATISDGAATERGLDGRFTYTVAQAETDQPLDELTVLIEGTNFAYAQGGGGYSTATLATTASAFNAIAEGAHTYGDLYRLATSILAGPVTDFTTGLLVFKSLDGTKTRATITTDSTGRINVVIGDLSP